MALKLGKCRLCLKLGNFDSIFTVDDSLMLAEKARECTGVKIYEGDGLPDKVCSECIQKLSSAYIFKQQCVGADQELRRNYVPPPGFISSPPPNRPSSDSAFSNVTNSSNFTKHLPSTENVMFSNASNGKRNLERDSTCSNDSIHKTPKRLEHRNIQKRPSLPSEYDHNADEPLMKSFKCKLCPKEFPMYRSLVSHENKIHRQQYRPLRKDADVKISKNNADVEDKLECDRCDKKFKLKIMLKHHQRVCEKSPSKTPSKELHVSLENINLIYNESQTVISCEYCSDVYESRDKLEEHMMFVHPAIWKKTCQPSKKVSVPCLFCHQLFDDYYVHKAHFKDCPKADESKKFECPVCGKLIYRKHTYFQHIKNMHFNLRFTASEAGVEPEACKMCFKKFPSQETLARHLMVHASKIQESGGIDSESRSIVADGSSVLSVECDVCGKGFKNKNTLMIHREKSHSEVPLQFEKEPNVEASTSAVNELQHRSYSESSEEDDDKTCYKCSKQFTSNRFLVQHKKKKHNLGLRGRRAEIFVRDCLVRCCICDFEMKVEGIKKHNRAHMMNGLKPNNLYTCGVCESTFNSRMALSKHIQSMHGLKKKVKNTMKPEDLNEVTCYICAKKMSSPKSLTRHINWHNSLGRFFNRQKAVHNRQAVSD